MAALGGGRSTLANQGSLYHVSWRPRLPGDYRAWAGENRQKTRRSLTEAADGSLHACNYTIPLHLLHS